MNSLVAFRNSQGVDARGTLLKLTRTTLIFEVYNPYSIVQLSEMLHDVHIRRGERVVYRGRAIVSNLVNTGLMLIVSANLLDSWSDLAGVLTDGPVVRQEVERFLADWEHSYQLRAGYQVIVSRLRSLLTELHRWLEQIDPTRHDQDHSAPRGLSDERFYDIAGPLLPRLGDLFQEFEHEATQVTDEEIITHKRFAQHDLHPLILSAPFVYRAFFKPLGYAGDYEMVNMMLREPREGPTIYAQLINTLYLQTGPAVAHRNRIEILVERLAEFARRKATSGEPLRVLNVGCGPAVEIQRLIGSKLDIKHCHFRFLDFNQETLVYAQERITEAAVSYHNEAKFEFVHESVHGLLKRATKGGSDAEEVKYDFVYCAGLFDYLSDRICARLLRLFYRWTEHDGIVMATNVHSGNPARNWMEHLLEWYLIYRDEKMMQELAPNPGAARTYVDDSGINVFLEISKK